MFCKCDFHCGIWHCWGNTVLHHAVYLQGCLLLHLTAAQLSSNAQEKTTILGGAESHHSSWQCKESHRCCCHGPLAPLAIEDFGTSTVLTRYESMRLRSFRQGERTIAREPVQHKRWTYPCYRGQYGTATKMDALMSAFQTFGKRWLPLWIKPCHKYQTVAITFFQSLVLHC